MKLRLSTLIVVAISLLSCGGKYINESKVPATVKDAFKSKFPSEQPKWEREDGNYEAGFTSGGKKRSVVISPAGVITESEAEIAMTDFPANAISYLKAHYDLAKVEDYTEIQKENGTIEYECEMKGRDILFDKNGNFINDKED